MHLTYQTYHLWLLVSTCNMYLPPISGYVWWNWGWFIVDQINSSSSSTPSESWHQPRRDDLQTEPRRWDCPRGSHCSRTCLVCHEWQNVMTWQWRDALWRELPWSTESTGVMAPCSRPGAPSERPLEISWKNRPPDVPSVPATSGTKSDFFLNLRSRIRHSLITHRKQNNSRVPWQKEGQFWSLCSAYIFKGGSQNG